MASIDRWASSGSPTLESVRFFPPCIEPDPVDPVRRTRVGRFAACCRTRSNGTAHVRTIERDLLSDSWVPGDGDLDSARELLEAISVEPAEVERGRSADPHVANEPAGAAADAPGRTPSTPWSNREHTPALQRPAVPAGALAAPEVRGVRRRLKGRPHRSPPADPRPCVRGRGDRSPDRVDREPSATGVGLRRRVRPPAGPRPRRWTSRSLRSRPTTGSTTIPR